MRLCKTDVALGRKSTKAVLWLDVDRWNQRWIVQALAHGFGRLRTRAVNEWCSPLETIAKKDDSERMQSSGLGRKGEMDEEVWGSGGGDGGRVTVGGTEGGKAE